MNWQANLLAAPVVSWVRKHYAEPVTSAAGFVNVGTPTRDREERSEVPAPALSQARLPELPWYVTSQEGQKHQSFLKIVNEATATILSLMYFITHLFKSSVNLDFFKPNTSIKNVIMSYHMMNKFVSSN